MAFALAYFIASLGGLLYASWTDLKTRLISNKLTFGLFFLGLGLHAAESVYSNSWQPLIDSLLGGLAGLAFGLALYYTGVWAGGDVKLLAAIGALNPFPPVLFAPLARLDWPVFSATFFLYSILAIVPYSLFYAVRACVQRPSLNAKAFFMLKSKAPAIVRAAGVVAFLASAFEAYGFDLLWFLPAFIAVELLLSKAKAFANRAAGTLFLAGLALNPLTALSSSASLLASAGAIALFFGYFKVLREDVLREEKKVSELSEGDIPAEMVRLEGRKVVVEPFGLLSLLRPVKGVVLANPLNASGLEGEEIKRLKSLVRQGKLKDSIKLKKSIPFAPALVLGYLAGAFLGDLVWLAFGL